MAKKYLSEIIGISTHNEYNNVFKSKYILVTETTPGRCKTDIIYYPIFHNGSGGLPLKDAIRLLKRITADLKRELDAE